MATILWRVNGDIAQGAYYDKEYHEGWKFAGRRYWHPEWDVAPHYVICYIRISSDSRCDNNRDNNAPSIGNQMLKWRFESGETRDADWFLTARARFSAIKLLLKPSYRISLRLT